jgi:hypothetical protein
MNGSQAIELIKFNSKFRRSPGTFPDEFWFLASPYFQQAAYL